MRIATVFTERTHVIVAFVILLIALANVASAFSPIAQHVAVTVTPNTEIVIALKPSPGALSNAHVQILTAPAVGSLFQVSANFMNFGYLPAQGSPYVLGSNVVDPQARVVFSAPLAFQPTRFLYRYGNATAWSANGTVDLTLADSVVQSSVFNTGNDGWAIAGPVVTTTLWSGTSTGALNHYIFATTPSLQVGTDNTPRWYFKAPSMYGTGGSPWNGANLYGGRLSFSFGGFAGNFTVGSLFPNPVDFVRLECAHCTSATAVAQRNVVYNGGVVQFSFGLDELSGWLRDPLDSRITAWSTPTQCDMVHILAGLTAIKIYGDVTNGYEAVGIDGFTLTLPSSPSVPLACYPT